MKRRITIKDIAKALHIHHSTVSRALSNDDRVKEETRDLVLAYAHEHGFQINMNAVQLRGSKNNSIALIIPNINHTFFSDIVSQFTNLAYRKGYIISVFQTNEDSRQEEEIVNTIIKHNYAGIVASISKSTIDCKHFQNLQKFGIPLVFFDRVCSKISTQKVLIDNYDIIFKATEHLIEKGFRRIAQLTGPAHINVFNDRLQGYNDALVKHGLNYNRQMIINDDFTVEQGEQCLKELMTENEKPDAIISSSIHLTMGIALQARELNLSIPRDLGLITFGNHLSSRIMQPQLTSISQSENEIAELSFDLLDKMINKEIPIGVDCTTTVKAQIIFRESSR